MNKKQLIYNLLLGMLPLFVFIIADEMFGTTIGLIVAVTFGIGELIFTYLKQKYFDKLVIFDTALLVALGGISLLLDNDIFFKLKPALMEFILCLLLGISVFTPQNLILNMSQRYMKDMKISDEQENKMKQSIKIFFFIMLAHTGLVVYSAYYMSKEAWVFISGGLFYILFGVYFVAEVVRNKIQNKKSNAEEWLPMIDEKGQITGKMTRKHAHDKTFILHPVVHLHIINNDYQIFLQKRPIDKLVQPGKWDTAVGGHVAFGETIEKALQRETEEELQITDFKSIVLGQYIWETEIEKEIVFMYYAKFNDTIEVNKAEIDEGRFWSISEIKQGIGKNIFTPNFEKEFEILSKTILNNKTKKN